MYVTSYKINNSYTIYVNYSYINACIKASKKYKTQSSTNTIDTSKKSLNNIVKIGSKVYLLDLDTQEKEIFTIEHSEDANSSDSIISVNSPIGKALIGSKLKDTITVKVPAGVLNYKIVGLK